MLFLCLILLLLVIILAIPLVFLGSHKYNLSCFIFRELHCANLALVHQPLFPQLNCQGLFHQLMAFLNIQRLETQKLKF